MPETPKQQDSFGKVLTGLLKFGVRPKATPAAPGAPWDYIEFATSVGVDERTLRNWRSDSTLPETSDKNNQLELIEQALFGTSKAWDSERADLRQAFAWSHASRRAAQTAAQPKAIAKSPASISNISIRVPPFFTGRDDAMAEIEAAMGKFHGRVAITALKGMRGVGKTVLAAAYAEKHRADYRATWWVRAEQAGTMQTDLVSLGVRLGWAGEREAQDAALAKTLDGLRDHGAGVLLVFDNALDADSLRPFLPVGGAARVLITSNAHAWGTLAHPVDIRVWPQKVGAAFLTARLQRPHDQANAEALSAALHGLPLAHEMAAALCEELDWPFADYLRRFTATPAKLLADARAAPADYHDRLTVAATFDLAIARAQALHPAAEKLLVALAHLPPEPIPRFLLEDARADLPENLPALLADDGLDNAIRALRRVALLDLEDVADERAAAPPTPSLRLHRLVRVVAAARRDGAAAAAVRFGLVAALNRAYPNDCYNNPGSWPRARRLDPLAAGLLAEAGDPPDTAAAAMARLLSSLAGYRQFTLGDYAAARPFFRRALDLYEARCGPEHANTLASVNNLAFCLGSLGDAAAALPLFRRVLEARERVLGPEHPDTLTSVNNVAECLRALGDAAAAQPLFRRALEASERMLGPEHPDTLTSVNNLALCLQALGDATAALPLHRRELEACERVLGPEHPDTLRSVNNLAECLRALGDAAAALPLYRRALEASERVLGPDHPDTLTCVNNLAGCLLALGDAAAALPLFRRAAAGFAKVLGPEHPSTKLVRANLERAERAAGGGVGR